MWPVSRLPWSSRVFVVALALVAAGYVALVVAQARTRKPWNDEAMSASAGLTLASKGYLAMPFFDEATPGFHGIHHHVYYIFPLQMIALGLWYKIASFSLFTTRALSLLWALLLCFALYHLLKRLSGNAFIALLAVVLTAFDYQMIAAAAFGRYDMMVAALGFSGYTLFLLLRVRNFPLALFAGNACIALAGMTHPNGLVYFLGLCFLILYYDRRRITVREVALAAVPYLIGGAVWGWYILQDIPDFKDQFFGNAGNRVGLLHPWQTLVNEIRYRYLTAYGLMGHSAGHESSLVKFKALALAGYAAGLAICISSGSIRRNPGYRVLLSVTAIHVFFFTFYEGMKFNYYLVHLLPLYLSCLGVALYSAWQWRPQLRPVVAAAVILLVAVGAGGILLHVRLQEVQRIYDPAVAFVKQRASADDIVFASCSFGFGYGFGSGMIDDDTFGYFSKKAARFIVVEEIYADAFNVHRQRHPAIYNHIQQVMSNYRLAFESGDYKIYQRI